MESHELTIDDVENNIQHTLKLNLADFMRAQTDEEFAASLLHHARIISRVASRNRAKEMLPNTNSLVLNHDNLYDRNSVTEDLSEYMAPSPEDSQKDESFRMTTLWGYDQTVCLINSMKTHISDLQHPKKRKHVFENIANDLISSGYTVQEKGVQNKWKSLCRSYNKCKDTKNRTGQGPSRFLFFDLMDEILGDKPTNRSEHSLNILDEPGPSNGTDEQDQSNDVAHQTPEHQIENFQEKNQNGLEVSDTGTYQNKSRRTSKKKIKEDLVELKRKEYESRKIRHDEKMFLEHEKIEIEKKKLKLLEKYIDSKNIEKNSEEPKKIR